MAPKKRAQRASRTALVVLGMHRSGTSALAGVLGHMGADLPKDLMAPTEINPKGFFESNRITGLNEELLASGKRRWFDFKGLSQDWYASPKAAEFAISAQEALEAEFGRSYLFALKDPRICRLLPFWTRRSVVLAMNDVFGHAYPWPNEPIANDGTEFHLIERLWPAMTTHLGLESVFVHKLDEKRV